MLDEIRRQVFKKVPPAEPASTVAPERAPHRSCYYAMGLTRDEINRPFVGIAISGTRPLALINPLPSAAEAELHAAAAEAQPCTRDGSALGYM